MKTLWRGFRLVSVAVFLAEACFFAEYVHDYARATFALAVIILLNVYEPRWK